MESPRDPRDPTEGRTIVPLVLALQPMTVRPVETREELHRWEEMVAERIGLVPTEFDGTRACSVTWGDGGGDVDDPCCMPVGLEDMDPGHGMPLPIVIPTLDPYIEVSSPERLREWEDLMREKLGLARPEGASDGGVTWTTKPQGDCDECGSSLGI